jgi:large subunit ribosomal protein L4
MDISILNIQGKEVGKMDLDIAVFDGKIKHDLMHQAVVIYLANQRHGLACTKTRGEVSGGGRKPWRQKGTGRARVGSTRSPLWRKGGITFGPRPHSFRKDFPQRMKIMALKSALNSKLNDKEIIVLDDLKVTSNKTKDFSSIVKKLKIEDLRVRFIVENVDENLKLSTRNLPKVNTGIVKNLNTYEALDCKKIIFTKNAFEEIQGKIKKWLK